MKAKIGRPKSKNPRNRRLEIKLTDGELNRINNVAKETNQSRTDTILRGIDLVIQEMKKNNP
ncbi:hypothetical protein [Filifactor alocis]|uniref:hypothetical protein n=1 Tax=Filifactor alocis TaxID=143361 RepID=UPI0028E1F448|nr:hypothetical protein [Filifactor alocis]